MVSQPDDSNPKPRRRRGRKPKGAKLVNAAEVAAPVPVPEPNIVLHLRCGASDLEKNAFDATDTTDGVSSYQFSAQPACISLASESDPNRAVAPPENASRHHITRKLRTLARNLRSDCVSATKSACFWCTCPFDNPPVYIPTAEFSGSYQCYGCFCSPECATAHLFEESIDSATKFERYALLNYIYCGIYEHKDNIKPAPDPRYTLDKFYGNLSIQEYRKLLEDQRLLLVVNKPLTRVLPEIHEDNDNFGCTSSGNTGKFRLRKRQRPSKAQILDERFNLQTPAPQEQTLGLCH